LTSGYRKPEAVPPRAAPPDSAVRSGDESPPRADLARAEAEVRAHDRVSPDAELDSIAAVNLYVEAFVAGAKFAVEARRDRDPKGA